MDINDSVGVVSGDVVEGEESGKDDEVNGEGVEGLSNGLAKMVWVRFVLGVGDNFAGDIGVLSDKDPFSLWITTNDESNLNIFKELGLDMLDEV